MSLGLKIAVTGVILVVFCWIPVDDENPVWIAASFGAVLLMGLAMIPTGLLIALWS